MTAHARPVTRLAASLGICAALLNIAVAVSAQAAELSTRDIARLLFQTAPGSHPALDGKSFRRLDLSNLDFKKANLSKSDFFGADLSGADLSSTNLSGAILDRVTLVGARLDGANLDNASMMRPSPFSTLNPILREAPSFRAASLKGARFFGTFAGSDFSGADLTDSICAPTSKSGFIEHIWRTDFTSANLSRATLTRADMTRAQMSFAEFKGAVMRNVILRDADLSGADLTNADLTGADLTDADLTDADVTGADFAGAKFGGVKGLDTVKGLALAHNSEKMVR
jgi:uncharacterized protein YjbI with pentapeptide repeats